MRDNLEEYTKEEIDRFARQLRELELYNNRVENGEPVPDIPPFPEGTIIELSHYYTLVMEKEIEEHEKIDSPKPDR